MINNIPLNIMQSILLIHQTEDELYKIRNIFKFKEKKKLKENIKIVDDSLKAFNEIILDKKILYNLDHVLINNYYILMKYNFNCNIAFPYAEEYDPSKFVPFKIFKNTITSYEYNIINDNIIINRYSPRLGDKKILYDQEDNKSKYFYSKILMDEMTSLFYNFLYNKKSIE